MIPFHDCQKGSPPGKCAALDRLRAHAESLRAENQRLAGELAKVANFRTEPELPEPIAWQQELASYFKYWTHDPDETPPSPKYKPLFTADQLRAYALDAVRLNAPGDGLQKAVDALPVSADEGAWLLTMLAESNLQVKQRHILHQEERMGNTELAINKSTLCITNTSVDSLHLFLRMLMKLLRLTYKRKMLGRHQFL